MTNCKEIIIEKLIKLGADGLCTEDCCCYIDNIATCDYGYCLLCEPARKITKDNGDEKFVPLEKPLISASFKRIDFTFEQGSVPVDDSDGSVILDYVALLYKSKMDDGQAYGIIFPDFPGIIVSGETEQKAIENAKNEFPVYLKKLGKSMKDPKYTALRARIECEVI